MAASTRAARTACDSMSAAGSIAPSATPRAARSAARPSSSATSAQLSRDTTCARTRASSPSAWSGRRRYRWCAIASPRTLSPRNSSRSYDFARSVSHDECVKTASRSSAGRPSISVRSWLVDPVVSAMGHDVVDRLPYGRDLLCILVGDLEAELVFQLHDQLDKIERVRVEVGLEGRVLGHLLLVDAELLHQDAAAALECLLTIHALGSPVSGDATPETVLAWGSACKSDPGAAADTRRPRRPTTSASRPRAAYLMAFAMPRRPTFPWAITASPRTPRR